MPHAAVATSSTCLSYCCNALLPFELAVPVDHPFVTGMHVSCRQMISQCSAEWQLPLLGWGRKQTCGCALLTDGALMSCLRCSLTTGKMQRHIRRLQVSTCMPACSPLSHRSTLNPPMQLPNDLHDVNLRRTCPGIVHHFATSVLQQSGYCAGSYLMLQRCW